MRGVYKIGQPYQIDNVWYYPREQPDYDETGIASWYGPTFYGKRTANGEMYDGNALTAAHKTLPMPVNVRVTNLDNGKSLVVRVNDRGPYARGRIIDLSKRAAELLDVVQTGTARVRVTYLGRADLNGAPPPSETPPAIANALPAAPSRQGGYRCLGRRAGRGAWRRRPVPQHCQSPRLDPAAMFADNQPTGQVTRVPVPSVTHLYVQVGRLLQAGECQDACWTRWAAICGFPLFNGADRHSIECAAARLASVADADAALARITGAGANDAHIVVDQ